MQQRGHEEITHRREASLVALEHVAHRLTLLVQLREETALLEHLLIDIVVLHILWYGVIILVGVVVGTLRGQHDTRLALFQERLDDIGELRLGEPQLLLVVCEIDYAHAVLGKRYELRTAFYVLGLVRRLNLPEKRVVTGYIRVQEGHGGGLAVIIRTRILFTHHIDGLQAGLEAVNQVLKEITLTAAVINVQVSGRGLVQLMCLTQLLDMTLTDTSGHIQYRHTVTRQELIQIRRKQAVLVIPAGVRQFIQSVHTRLLLGTVRQVPHGGLELVNHRVDGTLESCGQVSGIEQTLGTAGNLCRQSGQSDKGRLLLIRRLEFPDIESSHEILQPRPRVVGHPLSHIPALCTRYLVRILTGGQQHAAHIQAARQ